MSADSTQRGVEAGMMARTASPAVIVLSPVEAHGERQAIITHHEGKTRSEGNGDGA